MSVLTSQKLPSKAIVTGATLELTRLDFKKTNNTVRLTGAKWGGRFVNPDDRQFVYISDSSLYSAISLGQTYHWWADPSKKTWTLNSTAVKDLQWGPGHQDRFTIGIDTTKILRPPTIHSHGSGMRVTGKRIRPSSS